MKNFLVIFGKPRYLGFLSDAENDMAKGTQIILSSARGEEIGVLAGPITKEQAESYRNDLTLNGTEGAPRGGEPAFQDVRFIREANEEDRAERINQEEDENRILVKGREILKSHELEMKLVDVEFLLDRKKLFFYFTAEQRVDFRAYVRDLAKEFKTRIELRQIGVRDESKVVKGISPCGMPCCCSYWLNRFAPICIRMVKEQNLALNPTKISGICGRLMCCMGYEHEHYRDVWKGLPGPGSKIKTPTANYIVSGIDVAEEKVRIISPGSGEMFIDVKDFGIFRETVMRGEVWSEAPVAAAVSFTEDDPSATVRPERKSETQKTPGSEAGEEIKDRRETQEKETRPASEVKEETQTRKRKKRRNNLSRKRDKEVQGNATERIVPEGEKVSDHALPGQGERKRPRRRRPKSGKTEKPKQ